MRKLFFIISLLILNISIYSQEEINFGDFQKPVPSVSYLSSYIERPVSLSTGVPNISIPLFSLDTYNNNVKIQTLLSYNIENTKIDDAAGEIGLGWSLTGKGVISRDINNDVDEIYDNNTASNYKVNEFDDVYYYNLPNGISGKFRFIRDISNNTFSVLNLSQNKVKIDYTRSSNTSTLIIESFTITDDYGVKYVFNDYSISVTSINWSKKSYNSAFFISKILDTNNNEIVTYYYQKKERYSSGNILEYKTCKLSDISSKSKGSISINYLYDSTLENTLNDPDYITSVNFADQYGKNMYKYVFNYGTTYFDNYGTTYPKRILKDIKKQNSNQQDIEKTIFDYDPIKGLLYRIQSPLGSIIEYNFESNDYYLNKEDVSYLNNIRGTYSDPDIQYFEDGTTISYDTKNTKFYTLNISGTANAPTRIYLNHYNSDLYPPVFDPFGGVGCECQDANGNTYLDPDCSCSNNNSNLYIDYKITKNGEVFEGYVVPTTYMQKIYDLYPGTYTVEIFGTGGKGDLVPSEVKFKNPPYKNSATASGYRIKDIKYYNTNTDYIPASTESYYYIDFVSPLNSSGYVFSYDGDNSYYTYILYKNVKVTDGNNGYTKYYFKTPNDYTKSQITINNEPREYWPYYSNTKSGVLQKKELYNSSNQLISSTEYNSVFDEIPNTDYYKLFSYQYSKRSFLKSSSQVEKIYNIGTQNYIQATTENNYNSSNYNISSSKNTSSDGTVSEKLFKYAQDKNLQNLITANMISIPLETETKINNKTVSKTEIKYENTTTLFPSSVVSTNPNDSSTKTAIKYDSYDADGNLVQYTTDYDTDSGKGNTVTIIWGYNKTLPIAKIEGAKLADIGTLADDIVTKSNADIDTATENTLLTALDTFRNETSLKDYLITTYTYDPLIGVTTVTPPSGMRQIHKYDANNRLKSVTDANGNIIKEMKYNNKQ